MKLLNNIWAFAAASLLVGGCASEDPAGNAVADGKKMVEVPMTINVNLGGDQTRTELNDNGTTLKWQWSTGKTEKILVTNQKGEQAGILTLDEIVANTENKKATFTGIISVNEDAAGQTEKFNFYYAGDDVAVDNLSGIHTINLGEQSGKVEDLQKLDVLSAQADVYVSTQVITVEDLAMSHRLAAGKFALTFPEEVTSLKSLELTGTNIKETAYISLAGDMPLTYEAPTKSSDDDDKPFDPSELFGDGDAVTGSASAEATGTIPAAAPSINVKVQEGEKPTTVYLMLPPTLQDEQLSDLTFTAKGDNDKTYTGVIDANPFTLQGGDYVCLVEEGENNGKGFPVVLQEMIDYKVTLKDENGNEYKPDGFNPGEPSTEDSQVVALPDGPAKENYDFVGWVEEGTTDSTPQKDSWTLTKDKPQVTLVPVYEAKVLYTVKWVYGYENAPNNGLIKEETYTIKNATGFDEYNRFRINIENDYPEKPERIGYKCSGWEPDLKEIKQEYNTESVITIAATWKKAQEYAQLILNANFEGANPGSITIDLPIDERGWVSFNFGQEYTELVDRDGTTKLPLREGYVFKGWGTAPNTTTSGLDAEESWKVSNSKTSTYYAIWEKINTVSTSGYQHGTFKQ